MPATAQQVHHFAFQTGVWSLLKLAVQVNRRQGHYRRNYEERGTTCCWFIAALLQLLLHTLIYLFIYLLIYSFSY